MTVSRTSACRSGERSGPVGQPFSVMRIGTAAVAHYFLPRLRVAPLAAGLAFLAAPFTVGYFYPTWLFLSAAVCPWLVLSVLRGTTTTSRWRGWSRSL